MPIADPELKKKRRKERHEKDMLRMATDPQFAARRKAQDAAAKKKYEAKLKLKREVARIEKEQELRKGKPGRIVALCGWMNW